MLRSARNCRLVKMSAAVLIAAAILMFGIAGGGSPGSGLFVSTAHAQSNVKEKAGKEKIIKDIKSLIERLHHGELPEGIAKTNGRIEATAVDVSSKYAGRLESVMVNEGNEVKVGEVIERIDSDYYKVQLRNGKGHVMNGR